MKTNTLTHLAAVLASLTLAAVAASGCKKGDKSDSAGKTAESTGGATDKGGKVGGDVIKIDGSSTVFPVTQAVAEEFQKDRGGRVTVGVSGTGGGFKKFCRGETAISGASRPIKPTEVEQCGKSGIEFVELPVAYDGLAVVVHPKADWVDKLTVAELESTLR